MIVVPERHAIEEAPGLVIRELKRPGLAAVVGLVDARLLARSRREQVSFVFAECLDVAKIQRFRPGHVCRDPGRSAVERAQVGAVCAARPDYAGRSRAEATQVGRGIAVLNGERLRQGERGKRDG